MLTSTVISRPLVLVVDDEPHMCHILRRILEKERYRVITAPDGESALSLVKERKPDVMLLDLMMPGIDGREVCRRVREFSSATQIVYFTAKADSLGSLKLTGLRNEADAFIIKPATTKQILSKVNSVLKGSHR